MDSNEMDELEQGTEVWKGKQKCNGLKYKRIEDH